MADAESTRIGGRGNPFVRHLHAFRGFAILSIAATHAIWSQTYIASAGESSVGIHTLTVANDVLFRDATIYFSLISGLLFSMVLQQKGWPRFFRSKLRNVVAPYITMTLLFTWYGLNFKNIDIGRYDGSADLFAGPFDGSLSDYAHEVVRNLIRGEAMIQFWYIPVLVCLYIATPLIARVLAQDSLRWLVVPVVLAPLVASRTGIVVSWSSVIYFLGAYSLGMFVGKDYERILAVLRRNRYVLAVMASATTLVLIAMLYVGVDFYGPVSIVETFLYIQKLSIAGLVLVWFHAREAKLPRFLDSLGTHAFSIYFLHMILMFVFVEAQLRVLPVFVSTGISIALSLLALGFAIPASVLLSVIARRMIGTRSRLFVGA